MHSNITKLHKAGSPWNIYKTPAKMSILSCCRLYLLAKYLQVLYLFLISFKRWKQASALCLKKSLWICRRNKSWLLDL